MKVYLGTDHAGFELKEHIKKFLEDIMLCDVDDKGAHMYDAQDDYPDFIHPVALAVVQDLMNGEKSFGVVFGGTGQGEAMVANRVKGVRCAVYNGGSQEVVVLSRTHNDANLLSLGARFLSEEDAVDIVRTWLMTEFSGDERHVRRLAKF